MVTLTNQLTDKTNIVQSAFSEVGKQKAEIYNYSSLTKLYSLKNPINILLKSQVSQKVLETMNNAMVK